MSTELLKEDLRWALRRTPVAVLQLLKTRPGMVFVGGGFLRSCVAGEPASDIDLFVPSMEMAKTSAWFLAAKLKQEKIYETDNAITIKGAQIPIQIIHRWTYENPEQLMVSFDFTIAMAGFWWDSDSVPNQSPAYVSQPGWRSICDPRFYPDLAARRLHYTSPHRSEDAGGSMLRVLKFYQKGYRIPLDSLGAVTARLVNGVREYGQDEKDFAKVLTGLLREVDPNIDPTHIAHLPAADEPESTEEVLND